LSHSLTHQLCELTGKDIPRISFADVSKDLVPSGAVVFSTLETERPLLSTLTDDEMVRLKVITDNASNLVWATGGGLLKGVNPDFGLVSGLSRAMMLEQPSLRFFTFDIDQVDVQPTKTAENMIAVLNQQRNENLDFEFIQHQSVIHVSRFVPDDALNDAFRQKQGAEAISMTLADAKPARLYIDQVGQFDTIYFKKEVAPEQTLKSDHVEVEVKSVGLNAKVTFVSIVL